MKKDIFIDNSLTCKFANPIEQSFKDLISWIKTNDPINPENNAYLVLSPYIIREYYNSNKDARVNTCLPVIVDQLTREGRRTFFNKKQIESFKQINFKKKITKSFISNKKDWDHFPIVLMSDRKYALSLDIKFINDLINYPGFDVTAVNSPELLDYRV